MKGNFMKFIFSIFIAIFCLNSFCFSEKIDTSHFHVMTVASKPHDGLNRLLTSCNHYNIPIEIVGFGINPWPGNGQKLHCMKKYLEDIPDDHVVMFVDGFDTFFVATKEQILQRFLEKNTSCIFSTERIIAPYHLNDTYGPLFPKSPTAWKYLNSGGYIGYAGYLKHMLKGMEPFELTSDQAQFIKYYTSHQKEISLDYFMEFFLPLPFITSNNLKIDADKKSVTFLVTGSTPFVIHGNGRAKSVYKEIYETLFKKSKK